LTGDDAQVVEDPRRHNMTDFSDELTGTIVGSPTPDDSGMVTFKVRVGKEIILGVAHPCGSRTREDSAAMKAGVAGAVMRVVSRYVEQYGEHMAPLYREAARLRRAAGNPPIGGNTRRGRANVVCTPVKMAELGVVFTTETKGTRLKVAILKNGGFDFAEECEVVETVSEEDRDEAVTACLDYVFAHPDEAAALGLDLALLDELWR
jgi:hypothetical protein